MTISRPYLIQRGTIAEDWKTYPEYLRLSRVVDLDYMGSAEFEFGALPNSFRQMEKNFSQYNSKELPSITENGKPLFIFSDLAIEDLKKYEQHLLDLKEGNGRLKESISFTPSRLNYRKDNFWWDINNHLMFSYNKEFMQKLKTFVQNSLDYMNSKE